jgi:hypothetical protein
MSTLIVPIELVPNSKGSIYFGEETMTSLIPGYGLNVIRRTTLIKLLFISNSPGARKLGIHRHFQMHVAEQQGGSYRFNTIM